MGEGACVGGERYALTSCMRDQGSASGRFETSGHRCVHGGENASGAKEPSMCVGFGLFRFL